LPTGRTVDDSRVSLYKGAICNSLADFVQRGAMVNGSLDVFVFVCTFSCAKYGKSEVFVFHSRKKENGTAAALRSINDNGDNIGL
jgi:hypothetical protein